MSETKVEHDNFESSTNSKEDDISHAIEKVSLSAMPPPAELTSLSRRELEEEARARVRAHLESQKKKNRQKGAFRTRNSNKSYSKGKRVYSDSVF